MVRQSHYFTKASPPEMRHLSYRGSSFSTPCWYQSVSCYYQPPGHNCFHLPVFFRCIRKTAKSDYQLSHVRLTALKKSTPTGWIFIKGDVWVLLDSLSRILKFHWNLTRITGTLHKDKHTFLIISRSVLLRKKKMFKTKVVDKIKTHILRPIFFFRKSCRLWDNVEKYCIAGQATDDNMVHAHCMLHN